MSLDELAQSSGARSESERADLLDEIAGLWLGLSQRDIARKFDLKAGVISGIVMRARRRGDERFPSRLNPAPKVRPARIRKLKQIAAAPVPSLGRIGAPVQFLLAVPGMCKFPLNSPESGSVGSTMLCCAAGRCLLRHLRREGRCYSRRRQAVRAAPLWLSRFDELPRVTHRGLALFPAQRLSHRSLLMAFCAVSSRLPCV